MKAQSRDGKSAEETVKFGVKVPVALEECKTGMGKGGKLKMCFELSKEARYTRNTKTVKKSSDRVRVGTAVGF